MATLIGLDLGGYRIISQVGKGGMATVYKAFQPSLDRYVAVKVMPPFYAQEDETFIKRFKREAQSIAKLRHPNILLVIDFGEKDSLIYIVMEFVDAGTLTDRLGLPMPVDQAVKILDQIASALDYAHMQGLVHRDVKPSNILLPKPDWPLLTDFGLAKIIGGSQLTITGTIAGTPAYMSPEQGQGESVDSRTDIYSLGIVLYEMMTGGVPYTAETPMAVVVKHIIEPLPLPTSKNPNISEPIERVILKALAKNPDDRYQRATELSQAFREAVGAGASIDDARPTVLEEVESGLVVETMVDSEDFRQPVIDSVPSANKVVTEKPPPISLPEEIPQIESIPDVTPSKPAISAKGLMQQRPWLKWFLPAGAAGTALCAIALLIAFVIVPTIRDNLGTEIPIAATLTAGEHITEGHNFFEAGDYEAAILEYESAIAQGADDAAMYFSLATSYSEVGRVEEALGTVDKVIRLYPGESWVHESAGNFYQTLDYHYEAISEYENALEIDPDANWILNSLADSYMAVGEYAKAEEILARGENPKEQQNPQVLEEQGWEHLNNGDYPAAEESFRRAVEIKPDLVEAWEGLSDVFWYQDDYARAIEILREGIEFNPEAAYLYEKLGWLHYYEDELEDAVWAFNNAVFYDPYSINAWDGLADVYWFWDEIPTAIEVVQTALENNPDNDVLYEKLGWLYYENGNYDAAIETLEYAIQLEPDWSAAYSTLADIWYELGETDQIFAILEEGIATNPSRSDLHETLGWYYMDFERYQDSIAAFNDAITVNPEYGWPYIGLATVHTILGNWNEANTALMNADTYSFDDPYLLESIGWGYAELGDCQTAISYFNQVLEIDPSNFGAEDGLDYCSG